ncbi:hypothetical protein B0H17DRAFT_1123505 [Mycena rosella]|uniref:Secreted protein n=1 Tax=Mycena rosella TaxID=1033263 RepID=A0AAD7MCB4_MYCRO|nr:hypothetical protein B0H17DRAFT_1123505 [Mycena rosella]
MAYHVVSLALRLAALLSGALMHVTIPSSSGTFVISTLGARKCLVESQLYGTGKFIVRMQFWINWRQTLCEILNHNGRTRRARNVYHIAIRDQTGVALFTRSLDRFATLSLLQIIIRMTIKMYPHKTARKERTSSLTAKQLIHYSSRYVHCDPATECSEPSSGKWEGERRHILASYVAN